MLQIHVEVVNYTFFCLFTKLLFAVCFLYSALGSTTPRLLHLGGLQRRDINKKNEEHMSAARPLYREVRLYCSTYTAKRILLSIHSSLHEVYAALYLCAEETHTTPQDPLLVLFQDPVNWVEPANVLRACLSPPFLRQSFICVLYHPHDDMVGQVGRLLSRWSASSSALN